MNKSQTVYMRAGISALILGVLFYFVAPLTFSMPDTDIGLVAALTAIIASLVTAVILSIDFNCTEKVCGSSSVASGRNKQDTLKQGSRPAEISGDVKTLYVGNLPYRANETAIRKLFSDYGTVISVRLVKDKETGKRRGYGFVEMPESEARAAVAALNETEYLQRTLKVREANDKRDTPEDEMASNSSEA